MSQVKSLTNVDLKDYTSLRAGGPAENLLELDTEDDLAAVLRSGLKPPVYLLGYGTNVLVSDKGLPGTVIINKSGHIKKDGQRYVVDSGVDWDKFIQQAIKDNSWGLEFTSGIPGGTGAALAGSIAAYGHRVEDQVVEAEIMDLSDGSVTIWPKDKMKLGYRSSVFHDPENSNKVILNVTFQLSGKPTGPMEYESALKIARELNYDIETLEGRRQTILEARKRAASLLPDIKAGPWTAGSFFHNPIVSMEKLEELAAYEENQISRQRLIDQSLLHGQGDIRVPAALVMLAAGFQRGQTWGQVRLHPTHILKIENLGQATANEIYEVVQNIIKVAKDKTGIELHPEVRLIGEF